MVEGWAEGCGGKAGGGKVRSDAGGGLIGKWRGPLSGESCGGY